MPYNETPWQDSPSTATSVDAARLTNIDFFLDARQWGVAADNATDNATPFANFMTAITSAGPGAKGIVPAGIMLTSGPITAPTSFAQLNGIGAAGLRLGGHGMGASIIRKEFNGPLIKLNGTGQNAILWFSGLEDMTLDGGNHTGVLIDSVYTAGHVHERVRLTNNSDIGADCVQTWDARFDHCWFDGVTPRGSGAATTSTPAVYVRSSRATSGFGSSADNSNQVKFRGCNWVSNIGPDLRVGTGVAATGGSADCAMVSVKECKMESAYVGTDRLIMDNSVHTSHIDDLYVGLIGFGSGFSTPVSGISWQGAEFCTMDRVNIITGAASLCAQGVYAWAGADNGFSMSRVWGNYQAGAPSSGLHVNQAGGAPISFRDINCVGSATPLGGAGYASGGGGPLKCVVGVPSDASFPKVPPIGTCALNLTSGLIYAKTLATGGWVAQ